VDGARDVLGRRRTSAGGPAAGGGEALLLGRGVDVVELWAEVDERRRGREV
jgi:hypothetical protein